MPNRTICSALEEMRALYKSYNFAGILGLIEEVQSMANRMESALYDLHDHDRLLADIKKLKAEKKAIKKELGKPPREHFTPYGED